jgi:hypothetical protein
MQNGKPLNIVLTYDLGILLLGIYTKELKAGTQTYIFMGIFIATVSIIAKSSKCQTQEVGQDGGLETSCLTLGESNIIETTF